MTKILQIQKVYIGDYLELALLYSNFLNELENVDEIDDTLITNIIKNIILNQNFTE